MLELMNRKPLILTPLGLGVVHLEVVTFYFLRGGVSRPRGPASPLLWACLLWFLILFLALACFGLLSQKKDTNSSSIDMWQMFEKERERNHLYCIKESPLQYSRNIQESSCKRDREWHRVGKPEFSSSLQGHQANPDKGALILTPPPTPKLNIQGSCGIFDFRI